MGTIKTVLTNFLASEAWSLCCLTCDLFHCITCGHALADLCRPFLF